MGSDWAGLTDGERESYVAAAKDATDDLWVCTRVWEAWSVGTMTESDFRRASHDDDVVNDVAAAAYAAGATLRARAEAAEQRAEALATELAQARDAAELERGHVAGLELCVATRNEAVAEAHAALSQARDDRALLAGLWLATVPPDVLPAVLPTDPGDRDRLAAALDAVDLQPSEAAHIAAGRAVIARIVAEMGGGAA